jgi:HEAT repeat protein
MVPGQIVEEVKRKNWDLVEEPGRVGPDAVPALLPLLNDADPQVRELTVHCLAMAGGPEATRGLLAALDDRIETVSAAAVRGVEKHFTARDVETLRAQMARNPNEYVRERIALMLGKTDDRSNVPALASRKPAEKDRDARHAIVLALARLGDVESKNDVRSNLQNEQVEVRVGALRHLPYVNDRALLADAAPLLDDERPGLNIGPSHGPYFMRVCDVVVMVMGEMLGDALSFETGRRRYTAQEIAEAKAVLSRLR